MLRWFVDHVCRAGRQAINAWEMGRNLTEFADNEVSGEWFLMVCTHCGFSD